MAVSPTLKGSGSQVCTVTTEHTLLDIAVAGAFEFELDMNPAVDADVFEWRVYAIVLTGGTRRVLDMGRIMDAQPADMKIWRSTPYLNDLTDAGSLRFTLLQVVGTSRTIPWKVVQI